MVSLDKIVTSVGFTSLRTLFRHYTGMTYAMDQPEVEGALAAFNVCFEFLDEILSPFDLFFTRREGFLDDRNLRRMDDLLASETEFHTFESLFSETLGVCNATLDSQFRFENRNLRGKGLNELLRRNSPL